MKWLVVSILFANGLFYSNSLELAETVECSLHSHCERIEDDSPGGIGVAYCTVDGCGCTDDTWLIFTNNVDPPNEELKCYPGICAVCPDEVYCCNDAIPEAECNSGSGTCQCSDQFISTSNLAECLPKSVYLAEKEDITCDNDADCEYIRDPSGEQPTASATCESEQCGCVGENWSVFTNGTTYACYRGLGAVCADPNSGTSVECVAVENADCRPVGSGAGDATCQCMDSFIESSNKCLTKASSDNRYKCEDNVQCQDVTYSKCDTDYGECLCGDDLVVRPKKDGNSGCIAVKEASCATNLDCSVAGFYSCTFKSGCWTCA